MIHLRVGQQPRGFKNIGIGRHESVRFLNIQGFCRRLTEVGYYPRPLHRCVPGSDVARICQPTCLRRKMMTFMTASAPASQTFGDQSVPG